MFHDYNIGYLNGRNHTLELTARWLNDILLKHRLSENEIFLILRDKTTLKEALLDYDPEFFNNYDELSDHLNKQKS